MGISFHLFDGKICVPKNDNDTWTTTIPSILHIPYIFEQTARQQIHSAADQQDTLLKRDAKSVRYGVFCFWILNCFMVL